MFDHLQKMLSCVKLHTATVAASGRPWWWAGGCAVVCSRRRLIARLTSPADDCSAMVACSSVKPIATSDETAPSSMILAFSGLLGSASSRQLYRDSTIAAGARFACVTRAHREAGRTQRLSISAFWVPIVLAKCRNQVCTTRGD